MSARAELAAARSDQGAGFTLLEVIVASAVTAMIVAVLLGLAVTMLAQWTRTQGRLGAEKQAQAVLDYLTQDLQGALQDEPGSLRLAATIGPGDGPSGAWIDPSNPKPVSASLAPAIDDLRTARFGRTGVWLRFFTHRLGTRADDAEGVNVANPVAVSYQVIRRPLTPTGANSHYFLYRAEVSTMATSDTGLDLGAEGYGDASAAAAGAAGNVVAPTRRQVIAENVIDFGVRFFTHERDPATGRMELQRRFSKAADDVEYLVAPASATSDAPEPFPDVAEVMVRILTEEGARQIAALEANALAGDWWSVAEAHSYVFIRRILIPSEDR